MIMPAWRDTERLGFVLSARCCRRSVSRVRNRAALHPAGGNEDVCWLEIAMNDSFGVRGFERRSDLRGEPQRLAGGRARCCSRETTGVPSMHSMTR